MFCLRRGLREGLGLGGGVQAQHSYMGRGGGSVKALYVQGPANTVVDSQGCKLVARPHSGGLLNKQGKRGLTCSYLLIYSE